MKSGNLRSLKTLRHCRTTLASQAKSCRREQGHATTSPDKGAFTSSVSLTDTLVITESIIPAVAPIETCFTTFAWSLGKSDGTILDCHGNCLPFTQTEPDGKTRQLLLLFMASLEMVCVHDATNQTWDTKGIAFRSTRVMVQYRFTYVRFPAVFPRDPVNQL